MTRIGDSSDDQRIQEMIEADHRLKVDQQKRSDQERVSKSFQEVMTQRSSKETALKQAATQKASKDAQDARKDPQAEANQKRALLGHPRSQDLQKRAQLATQQQGQLQKTRTEHAESARAQESDRAVDLVKRGDDERERVDKDIDVDRGVDQRVEERRSELRGDHGLAVDEDASGRGQRERRKGDEEGEPKREAQAVGKTEGAKGAAPVKIPQELIEHIAKSVAIAVAADGRTEMAISLKGTMLDGVTLHVTAKKGKVRCTFEGCDRQLANLIESSKGELMRQLGKRGLELDFLKAK